MHTCESWTMKKAERQRTNALELWCWRRFLRVPWTARRANQSILKAVNPEYSLEGLILKLKLQYFGHLIWRLTYWKRPSCWVGLKAKGAGGGREWDGEIASPVQWTWVWAISGSLPCYSPWNCRVGHDVTTKQQENTVCHCFHWSPIYLPWSDGTRCHDLSFLNIEFFFFF